MRPVATTSSLPPRPRSGVRPPSYPRALGGLLALSVGLGMANACGGNPGTYDAPHWDHDPWNPIDKERDAGTCEGDASCWPFATDAGTGGTGSTGGHAGAATGGSAGATTGGAETGGASGAAP